MNFTNHFDRYIGKTVFFGTLFALFVLFSIDSIIDLLNTMEAIGKRGFTFGHAILQLMLEMPQRFYEFTPTALLLGTLVGLGNLAAKSELVAIRAVGVSKLHIIWAILKVGIVIILISIWVGETIAPTTEGYVRGLSKTSDMKKIAIRSEHGLWIRNGKRYINVQGIYPDYRMTDVWIYELDDEYKLKRASFAEQAVFENDIWVLTEIKHSLITQNGVETVEATKEHWDQLVTPELFGVVTVKPEQMGAGQLRKYIKYLDKNELDSRRFQLAFYNRFAIPLSGIAMIMLAVPFVFRSARAGGLGQRMALGISIALLFHLLSRIFSNASVVYELPPLLGAFLPTLMVVLIAMVALKKLA